VLASSDHAFQKAPAVSCALMSYWSAYLKANDPDEFAYAALGLAERAK
jgi:DNA polymerase III alpha subunit